MAEDQGASHAISLSGPDRKLVDSITVASGTTVTTESVPFGGVKIDAAAVCSGEDELNSQAPTIRLNVAGSNCTLSN